MMLKEMMMFYVSSDSVRYRSIILVLILFSNSIMGQVFVGLSLNGNYNNVSGIALPSFAVKEARNGFGVSTIVDICVTDWLSVNSGIGYKQKNYRVDRTGFYDGIFYEYDNNYLQIPLKARLIEGNKVKFFTDVGAYGSYWISSKERSHQANILSPLPAPTRSDPTILDYYKRSTSSAKHQFDKEKDQRFELGLVVGMGMQYILGNSSSIFLSADYEYALTSMQKKTYATQQLPYNRTWGINAGVLLRNLKFSK